MFSEILSNISSASGLRLSKYRLEIAMKKQGWDNNRVGKRMENGVRYVYVVEEKFMPDGRGNFEFKE